MLNLFSVLLVISSLGENCGDIVCANIFDYVCGMAKAKDGTRIIMKYQNICYMRKKACELKSVVDIKQVADGLCSIKKKRIKMSHDDYPSEGRRIFDFSIVGAHQTCNHSCPTFCTDTYEPACAQIWKHNMFSYTYRPMINHCHIDLFSCAAGVNVTIQPLGKCYKNPSGLLFMQQIAAMKSLNLLDEDELAEHNKYSPHQGRRVNEVARHEETQDVEEQDNITLKKHLVEIIRRVFDKYSRGSN